jgi:hypothetical protein
MAAVSSAFFIGAARMDNQSMSAFVRMANEQIDPGIYVPNVDIYVESFEVHMHRLLNG